MFGKLEVREWYFYVEFIFWVFLELGECGHVVVGVSFDLMIVEWLSEEGVELMQ